MRRPALVLVALLAACAGPAAPPGAAPPASGPLGMVWASVDSLDARLPPAVRVFAGVSERDTLRAWAVRLGAGVPLSVEVAADTADGREAPTAFAERTGACVVLNGGYFNVETGEPVGLVVDDGRLVSRAFDTVDRDGQAYPIARGALGLGRGGAQIATARDNGAAACLASTPNRRGAPAAVPACHPWDVAEALGAGPVVALDGRPALGTADEVFWGTSIPERHPRSAVGVEAGGPDAGGPGTGGAVWLVVVDGRQPASRGVTLPELAALVLGLGADDVLNLDGGGSSALVVRPPGGLPVRLNLPTGYDVEREVATALAARCR